MLTGLMSSGSVYCHRCRAKNCGNITIVTKFSYFGGSCAHPHYWSGQNLAENSRVHDLLYAYMPNFIWIHWLEQKPQFWVNFDIWGSWSPFTDKDQIWCARANPWSMLKIQILSWLVYSVPLWQRKTLNSVISGLWHFVVSSVGSDWRKLNTDAQLQTFPYPIISKSLM